MSVRPSVGPSVRGSVGPSLMLFLSAGRDEPANDLFRVYELVKGEIEKNRTLPLTPICDGNCLEFLIPPYG